LKASDRAFQAALEDVTATLRVYPQVRELRSPVEPRFRDQISADGHSALVQFTPRGDYDAAVAYIGHPSRGTPLRRDATAEPARDAG
jgi:hypothetical protein